MSFLRPEARTAIWRYREVLIVAVFAVFAALGTGGLMACVDWALIVGVNEFQTICVGTFAGCVVAALILWQLNLGDWR